MQPIDQDIREIAQEKFCDLFEQNRWRIGLVAGVGFGKSLTGIKCMKRYSGKWLIVAPTHSILDNWREEFVKWNFDASEVNFICYNSLPKTELFYYQGIILDEVHHVTPANTCTFEGGLSPLTAVVGLTGTEPTEPEKVAIINEYCPIIFRFGLNKAVEEGIVSDYRVVKIPVKLNDRIPNIQAGSKAKGYYQVTEQKKYDLLNAQVSYAKGQRKMMLYIQRSQFLGSCKTKTELAKVIIEMVRSTGEKFMIFCANISQAEELSPYTYHSKTTDDNLKAFKEGGIRELSVVSAADEGLSIAGIESAVVVSFNSKDRKFVQRLGRVLRRKDGKPAIIYCIFVQDTKDEDWFGNSIESLVPEKILDF